MKINFNSEKNYISFDRTESGKIYITLSAQDPKNPLSSVVNSVELSETELIKLVESVGIEIKLR